jgi:hypothetical protein
MNTYYELIKNLKTIFEQDSDINTVISEGDTTAIDNYKKNIFPLVHIEVVNSPYTGKLNTALTRFNVEITVVNLRDVNKEIVNDKFWLNDNRHDNWNMTRAILKKAQNKIIKDTTGTYITLESSTDAERLSWRFENTLDGWQQTWTLDVPDDLTTVC